MTGNELTMLCILDPKGNVAIENLPNGQTLILKPLHETYRFQNTIKCELIVVTGYDPTTGEWTHGHYVSGHSGIDGEMYEPAIQEACEYCGLPVDPWADDEDE